MIRYKPTKEVIKFLGTASDAAIARKFKICQSTVRHERLLRGIPAWSRKKWAPTKDERKLFESLSDAELAKRFNKSINSIRVTRLNRFGIKRNRGRKLLDLSHIPNSDFETMSSPQLAAKYNVATKSLLKERGMRGIVMFSKQMRPIRLLECAVVGMVAGREDATLKQVGDIVGISRERVRQIIERFNNVFKTKLRKQ